MEGEAASWTGISFGWAAFSMAIGMTILAVVGIRIWRELREERKSRQKQGRESGKKGEVESQDEETRKGNDEAQE